MKYIEGILFCISIVSVSCDNIKVAIFGLAIMAGIAIKENFVG